jgi:hypothetical protein
MDPNLFHLNWEPTFEVLGAIVVLAKLVERALALVSEQKLFVKHFGGKSIKETIAFAKKRSIESHFGYYADEWARTTPSNYSTS